MAVLTISLATMKYPAVASIARALNERGAACPSAADPHRNSHRAGGSWSVRTVAAILANPRLHLRVDIKQCLRLFSNVAVPRIDA